MIARFRFSVLMLIVVGLATAARAQDGSSTSPPLATQSEAKEPVIVLWNDGVHMVNLKPFLLFAAWEDGTVVRRGDVGKTMGGATSIHDWAARKLTVGSVKPSEVLVLQAAIAEAGFFRPPLADGMCFVDGPSQSLCVRYGKAHRLLSHYGPSDKGLRESIEELAPTSTPSREDAEAFAAMWDKVTRLIDAVAPKNMAEIRGQRELTRPEPFDPTDENGNPSIAYWGIPEYKEKKVNIGTPRSLTTMTTVQIVTREKYQTLKQAGKIRNEERHGNWLYFAVSDIAQIPNDTAYMEVITRYKVRMEEEQASQPAPNPAPPAAQPERYLK